MESLDYWTQHQGRSNREHVTRGGRCGGSLLVDEWDGGVIEKCSSKTAKLYEFRANILIATGLVMQQT